MGIYICALQCIWFSHFVCTVLVYFFGLSDNIILNQTNHPRRFAFDLSSTERFYLCLIIVDFLFLFVFVRGGVFLCLYCVCFGDFLLVCGGFLHSVFWGFEVFLNIKFNMYTCRIQALTL